MVPKCLQRGVHVLWIAVALLAGCDASQPAAPGSSGASGETPIPEDAVTAYRRTLPPVPESLKPFVAELEELTKQAKPQSQRNIPFVVLPGVLPYQIAEGGKLIAIDLAYTPVTDEFLTKFKNLLDLERINLIDTNITDAGLDHLSELPSLKELTLWASKVSEEGAAKFRESHPKCTVRGPDSSK